MSAPATVARGVGDGSRDGGASAAAAAPRRRRLRDAGATLAPATLASGDAGGSGDGDRAGSGDGDRSVTSIAAAAFRFFGALFSVGDSAPPRRRRAAARTRDRDGGARRSCDALARAPPRRVVCIGAHDRRLRRRAGAAAHRSFAVEVHPDWAPLGAARFVELVEEQFFDGVAFFRVIGGFMAQFGINGNLTKQKRWKSRAILDEASPARR
ncbi:hypothetical protein JL722_2699 [Aureococcus anophagefferens]|nr:hypothetical protein JL722_2699 [Aureococcus anophagefferens]